MHQKACRLALAEACICLYTLVSSCDVWEKIQHRQMNLFFNELGVMVYRPYMLAERRLGDAPKGASSGLGGGLHSLACSGFLLAMCGKMRYIDKMNVLLHCIGLAAVAKC